MKSFDNWYFENIQIFRDPSTMVEEDLLKTAIDELEKVVLHYYQMSDC